MMDIPAFEKREKVFTDDTNIKEKSLDQGFIGIVKKYSFGILKIFNGFQFCVNYLNEIAKKESG